MGSCHFEGLSAQKLEFVANAPNGLESPLVGNTLKLLTKALYVNVNCSGVTEIVEAPDLVKKLISGEHTVVVGSEEVEQLQLLGGNVNGLALELKLILLMAYFDVVELDDLVIVLVGVRLIAAKNGLNTGAELLHVEGLNNEIVRTQLKAEDLVEHLTLSGDHNNRL